MTDPDARERLRMHLMADEGCVLHAYQDHLGWWTIGVGHLIDKRKGGAIPAKIALDLLDSDIDVAIHQLVERYPWFLDLDQVRQAVLVNMAFNLGDVGLSKFVNTLAAVERGDYDAAARGMKMSLWARQVQSSRSSRLISMMRTGAWPETP